MTSNTKTANDLNVQRRRAVQLRLSGSTLADVRQEVGLSTPTIVAAVKAFKSGGWAAVDVKPRGRPSNKDSRDASVANAKPALLAHLLSDNAAGLWTTKRVKDWLTKEQQLDVSVQTAAGYLQSWQLLPDNQYRRMSASKASAAQTWLNGEYQDFKQQAKNNSTTLLWVGMQTIDGGATQLFAHTLRGRALWMQFKKAPAAQDYKQFFSQLIIEYPNGIALVLPNKNICEQAMKMQSHCDAPLLCITSLSTHFISTNQIANTNSEKGLLMNQPLPSHRNAANQELNKQNDSLAKPDNAGFSALPTSETGLTHLQRLEAESIHIMREVVAEANNPVMLYSIGKDSAVMMHLARKAFFPAPPPFPLLHVDTTWKFQEMYRFRDNIAQELGFELITHVNQEGVEKGVNPFTHGSALHTDIMKTESLKQALDKHGFDVALGGARRDEEKSRAKERVFSFRTAQHRWTPKDQRPELWNVYNTRKQPGESIRAFPLSNWTELDIWQYIHLQNIPVVPLYFAAERPVVERDGSLIMVDDDRMPLHEGEVPMMRKVRFRTLGCYPLTGAVESEATTLPEVIQEMLLTKTSERQGRMIDHDNAASMEKKKQEGYF